MDNIETVSIKDEFIKLDQFLKYAAVTGTGGESKYMIQEGMVKVSGEVELKRGRKLRRGDKISVDGIDAEFIIE